MYDHGVGRYGYRGFHVVVFGTNPAVLLIQDSLEPERGFEPIVRTRIDEALLAVGRMIDGHCQEEASAAAERLMG